MKAPVLEPVLPLGMVTVWRAHLEGRNLMDATIYVQAGNHEEAARKVRAVAIILAGSVEQAEDAISNLTSALDLVHQGVSADRVDRLFETGWRGDEVTSWVTRPIFCVRRPDLMMAAWLKAAGPIQINDDSW